MSVIAHSFGTHVLMKIIADHPEVRWNRIILCGSVVREDFPLQQYLERFFPPILNEIGTADYWPALAESIGWGYGSVGSTGFNRPPVVSRWHQGFTHSKFLTKAFCENQWVPFLRDGTIFRGDAPHALPLGIRLLASMPLRWLVPIAATVCIAIGLITTNLPFRSNNDLPARNRDFDVIDYVIPDRESTPVDSFSYSPAGSASPFTIPMRWEKKTASGVEYWVSKSKDEVMVSRFDIWRRIFKDSCPGTVVFMQGEFGDQVFIPDIETGCDQLFWRRLSARTGWQRLGQIDFRK